MEHILGKNVAYPEKYCPEILVAVPRALNREAYSIPPAGLFYGYDSWHAYEASFITRNGLPVTGILKLVYPAESNCIVESKSLKLYLGSFNMTQLGNTPEQGIQAYTQIIESDLGKLLNTKVKSCFFRRPEKQRFFDFDDYKILEDSVRLYNTLFTIYQEHPGFLIENSSAKNGEIKVGSHLLKSNCKITGQPDWGSIYIRMKANTLPDEIALLKYIVSLRNENHFHEEICEMTYKRLSDLFAPEIIAVTCLYTRRGGIDICPSRANKTEYLPPFLIQATSLTEKTFRQ